MKLCKFLSPLVFACIVLIGITLSSCASAPAVSENSISVEYLTREQVIKRFGIDQKKDPFIAPTGILKGKPYEFVVFKLSLSLAEKTSIKLTVDTRDNNGNTLSHWSKEDFTDMWKSWNADEASMMNREKIIEDFYAPDTSFSVKKGKSELYIVLIGKNPLILPINVTVDVHAESLIPYAKTFLIE